MTHTDTPSDVLTPIDFSDRQTSTPSEHERCTTSVVLSWRCDERKCDGRDNVLRRACAICVIYHALTFINIHTQLVLFKCDMMNYHVAPTTTPHIVTYSHTEHTHPLNYIFHSLVGAKSRLPFLHLFHVSIFVFLLVSSILVSCVQPPAPFPSPLPLPLGALCVIMFLYSLLCWLELLIDPTVLFATSCLLAPLYMLPERPAQAEVIAYVTEPSMMAAMTLLLVVGCLGILLRYRARQCSVSSRLNHKSVVSRAKKKTLATAAETAPTTASVAESGATSNTSVGGRLDRDLDATRVRESGDADEPTRLRSNAAAKRSPVSRVRAYVPLNYAERRRARWYLINGVIFHMLMDGCVGVFKTNTLFARNYAKLDRRYAEPLGSYNGSAVHVISLVELFIKGPICILLYLAMQTRHRTVDALEFFTCVTQAYGTIVYLGQEAISGAPNLDVDYDLTFSQHYLVYFWFAILFGCTLYLIVPTILAYRSFGRIVAHTSAAASKVSK